MHRRTSLQYLSALAASTVVSPVLAQASPQRQVRLIVPNPAGSGTDHVARVIAPFLGTALGQTVVVDNKGGANGVIAMQDLVRSPPDGSTLLIGSLSPLAINMALMNNLPYDSRRDITPIAGGYLSSQVLMVRPSHPARSFAEFIAHAKRQPGTVNIGFASSLSQATVGAMARQAGIEVLAVPYKGIPAAITDVIGGTIDATFVDTVNAQAQAKGGQLRPLAMASAKRNPVVPDWPTISETLPGFDFSGWTGIVGPRGMPRELVNRIHAAVSQLLKLKDIEDKLAAVGFVPWIVSPEELGRLIETDIAKWTQLAIDHKISL